MTEHLGQGFHLAVIGMGLVFVTLFMFMIILIVLKWIFPGDTNDDDSDQPKDRDNSEEDPMYGTRKQTAMHGGKMAAVAVAVQMVLGQDGGSSEVRHIVNIEAATQQNNSWASVGRESMWDSQGKRPTPFRHKSHSAYNVKTN